MPLMTIKKLALAPLKALDAEVNVGDCIALTGASGSGKTRLLYALADLAPHEGEAYIKQQACQSMPANHWRSRVMLIPSEIQWWYKTASEHFFHQPEPQQLRALGLTSDQLQQPVEQLSTGQRQRLAILRTLTRSPSVLLLDEATANLDEANTIAAENLILDWLAQEQRAIIWSSHQQAQVNRIANRVWHINQGIIEEKTP